MRGLRVVLLSMAVAAAGLVGATAGPASAQGIRCSAFLHDRDGTWRSFDEGFVLGPRGPIQVTAGERFSSAERSAKGEIARALDALCEGDAR